MSAAPLILVDRSTPPERVCPACRRYEKAASELLCTRCSDQATNAAARDAARRRHDEQVRREIDARRTRPAEPLIPQAEAARVKLLEEGREP